jgi:hypothetical protein
VQHPMWPELSDVQCFPCIPGLIRLIRLSRYGPHTYSVYIMTTSVGKKHVSRVTHVLDTRCKNNETYENFHQRVILYEPFCKCERRKPTLSPQLCPYPLQQSLASRSHVYNRNDFRFFLYVNLRRDLKHMTARRVDDRII